MPISSQKGRRLAALEVGGAPERPLEIASASLVETRAERDGCLRCGTRTRVGEHQAVLLGGERLRVARTECSQCGEQRTFYFRIVPAAPN